VRDRHLKFHEDRDNLAIPASALGPVDAVL